MAKERERRWSALVMAELGHEVRNMLGVIECLASLLAEELPPDSEAAEILGDLLHTSERSRRLSQHLVDLARGALSDGPADLVAVVARQVSTLRRVAPKGVTVDVDVCGGPVATPMPALDVEQVVYNLAHNAFDAMPSGGVLSIEVTTQGPTAALLVRDLGEGMDEETVARCFEPFFSTKAEHGTGIGLHAVRDAVEGAGGRVALASTPGRGTTVTIYLPILDASPAV